MVRKATLPRSDQSGTSAIEADATSLFVDIAQIQPYERNPRQGRNPEYDRIKDSIRSHGLDQPLVITQRPQASDYIVHAGGNTRLLILKSLYEETGDERFSRIQCVFRPWRCESDVLLAHLRENDLRGSLTFIDKAQAIHAARRLIAQESGVKEITQTQLETELRNAGYRIHQGLISRMTYAVETLLPLIPKALEAGMGKHHIGRIRALERASRTIWQRHCSGDDNAFDDVFAALCRRYDGPEWDTDLLQGAIETEIAEEAETSVHTIRVAIDAELKGREVVIPEFVPIKEPPAPNRQNEHHANPAQSEAVDDDDAFETETGFSQETDSFLNQDMEVPIDQEPMPSQTEDDGNEYD